jgi:hypothetical protein
MEGSQHGKRRRRRSELGRSLPEQETAGRCHRPGGSSGCKKERVDETRSCAGAPQDLPESRMSAYLQTGRIMIDDGPKGHANVCVLGGFKISSRQECLV